MNDLRKAAGEALEALEDVPYMSNKDDYERLERVKTALRQALVDDVNTSQDHVDETVKSEHEPVAWASTLDFDDDDIEIIPAKAKGKLGTSNCNIPLYIAPPKQWVGLVDEEELHLQAAAYANKRKEAYLDRMKQGSVEKLNQKMIDWLWMAHYEAYRDAIRARGSP